MKRLFRLPMQARQALRRAWWRLRLAALGSRADIQPGACFEYPGNIELGTQCRIARHSLIRANSEHRPGIRIGDRVHVQEFALINANRGHVSIGEDSWVGPHSVIYGNGGVTIGSDVMIASHCAINTVSHRCERGDIPMRLQGVYCDPVVIEDDVWIGTGAVILQGVRIGRGSIVGAGAVVTRSIPPGSVAIGVPARCTPRRKQSGASDQAVLELAGLGARRQKACH